LQEKYDVILWGMNLEYLVKTKKEEFSKAAEALFNRIEDVGEIEKLYYAALNSTQQ
jgi:rhamnogalacturonyl hydrolase YesR